MLSQLTLFIILFSTLSIAAASSIKKNDASAACATGFHIIVARAAGELPGESSTGTLAKDIVAKVSGSDSTPLKYPALPVPYNASEQAGVKQLNSDIDSYVKSCPTAKIVLLGYDQGAYVIGDVLGGYGANATNPIGGVNAKAIKGIILLGDPSFVPGQPYDAGTSTRAGKYPRSPASLKKMLRFSKIMKSYCDKGDTACASGNNAEANRGYLTKYETAATDFIVGLYHQ